MLVARLRSLERRRHIEYWLTVLDGSNPAGAKAIAVAQHLYVIDNRLLAVARA